jgi:hypothetical protein
MRNIDKLKLYLKETATKIRKTRQEYKEAQRARQSSYRKLWELHDLQRDFRHHHIAYCELRGRTREQIERPRDNNAPNEAEVRRIKEEYAWTPEEIAKYEERMARKNENVCAH